MDANIRAFLEGLLTDAGVVTLDEQAREEMIKELYARFDKYIASEIVRVLPPENLEAFVKLNEDKKSKEEIEAFLKDKMPNSADVFAKAFADFRALYIGNMTAARNAPAAAASSSETSQGTS